MTTVPFDNVMPSRKAHITASARCSCAVFPAPASHIEYNLWTEGAKFICICFMASLFPLIALKFISLLYTCLWMLSFHRRCIARNRFRYTCISDYSTFRHGEKAFDISHIIGYVRNSSYDPTNEITLCVLFRTIQPYGSESGGVSHSLWSPLSRLLH